MVFNFSVEGNHNYFVLAKEYEYGQTCVLVHNADVILYRNSASRNTRKQLADQSAFAEEKGVGIYQTHVHGISVSTTKPNIPHRSAPLEEVQKKFTVHKTPTNSDPNHFTVELPKPVTTSVRDQFYDLFKPTQ